MKLVLLALVALLLAAVAAMTWQHLRYLDARRSLVQDMQPLLYGSDAFHVVTYLRTAPGADVIDAVRKFKGETESFEGVRWVYAGKVVATPLQSERLGATEWIAVVVLQYPSRDGYEEAARSETLRQALGRFEATYSHGFERGALLNLMLPQLLLARRVGQIVTRAPSNFPFVPVPESELPERADRISERLRSERELGAEAIAIVNLVRRGTPEQQAADAEYGSSMIGAMAEGGYGPMHFAKAITVEGDHQFDRVAIVYYPGVEFFASLVGSEFFQGIIGGKQLGDSLSAITVPILPLL